MDQRELGKTGLIVSRLGLGLSEMGDQPLSQEQTAERILTKALDQGINFLDTAACYDNSEELIGRTIAGRRREFVLSTKAGHVAGDYVGQDWTAETVRDSIERSLTRMRTDCIDVVHLHSCSVEILERGEVIRALQDAKQAGKTRSIGYSGDNEAARWAVESSLFDTLQTSFNLVDQRARHNLFPLARERGMGIIAKRPIANAAWGATRSPSHYATEYFRRAQRMAEKGPIPSAPGERLVLALGFVLAHEAVNTAIVGTSNPEHLLQNIRWVHEELPISRKAVEELHHRFQELDAGWSQES
ncbi:MAG: aldo/keto reductase [Chloroflexi bacterium]|nr:MAG: aldo/keto reductase [Chloroflexota bacterium]